MLVYSYHKDRECGAESKTTLPLQGGRVCSFIQRAIEKGGPCDDGTPEAGRNRENAFTPADLVLF
jgi:hypothetical protein